MSPHRVRSTAPLLTALLFALLTLTLVRDAGAYPWMIRHEYTGCGMCHADPMGGGVLTEYGRAQGELLLRMPYGSGDEEMDPGTISGFAWGAFTPPEWLLLGGSFRGLGVSSKSEGADAQRRFVQMQADLRAVVQVDSFRAGGSLGYMHEGALYSRITHREKDNLVSREHWAGMSLKDDSILVRAGRMNLPFGVRSIEHTAWIRKVTRTDINDGQQHGVAAAYSGESVRGEVMAILGNFQMNPDDFRERGYAGFVEWTPAQRLALGFESLVTSSLLDLQDGVTTLRQAHGAYVRAAPWQPLVLTLEGSSLIKSPAGASTVLGYVGSLQGDYEIYQGLHGILMGELKNDGSLGSRPALGGWVSAAWFFAPHVDLRLDSIIRNEPTLDSSATSYTLLMQLHAYL